MTRASIRNAIDFRGVIEGCPDHQWLLTDALYETTEPPLSNSPPRWVVDSQVAFRGSPDDSADQGQTDQDQYVARDREHGWRLSASSPAALAQRIRRHCSGSDRTEP
jgi:hypothetical protein